MIDYPDYCKATNAAYKELERYDGGFPQIDIFRLIFSDRNIRLITYSQMAQRFGYTHNEFTYNIAQSEQGYSVRNKSTGKSQIIYNNLKDDKTIRFTLAHELGHIRLKHENDDETANREANCFARNILCPYPITEEYHLSTPEEYSECYGISIPMAEATMGNVRYDRINIDTNLYNEIRDKIYCSMTGFSLAELYGYCEPQYYY